MYPVEEVSTSKANIREKDTRITGLEDLEVRIGSSQALGLQALGLGFGLCLGSGCNGFFDASKTRCFVWMPKLGYAQARRL